MHDKEYSKIDIQFNDDNISTQCSTDSSIYCNNNSIVDDSQNYNDS